MISGPPLVLFPVHDFFYRFDGLDLVSGNKTAGFRVEMSTATLKALSKVTVSAEDYQALVSQMRERLERANLLPKSLRRHSGVTLLDATAVPRIFTTDPMLGGSLGANPEELAWLRDKDNYAEWLGDSLSYTPHNVDAARQALTLVILVQTWAEWAHMKLQRLEYDAQLVRAC